MKYNLQVQGAVNTLGDLRGTLAAVERINGILTAHEIDDSLAYGLNKELENSKIENLHRTKGANAHYMAALRSSDSCGNFAWSGDICLEGESFACWISKRKTISNNSEKFK